MQQTLNQHWNDCYEPGRDFNIESSLGISKFLSYADGAAPKTALDIGCGTGQLTRELWHRGYKVIGIDVSGYAVGLAKSLTVASDNELSYRQVDIEQDDLAGLPLQPYGLITCKLVYAFIQNKQAFLAKVAGLLDQAGVFVVITPLLETTPPEKKGIAVSKEDVELLREQFDQMAWYEAGTLGYFVGGIKS